MRRDSVEPLVDRALQLGLRFGQQFAHRLDPRAELDRALVGKLGRGGLLGGAQRGSGVGGRCTGSSQQEGNSDSENGDQASGCKQGGFHGGVLRDSAGR